MGMTSAFAVLLAHVKRRHPLSALI